MAGRVTIQDIADSLGLSRNTVSKAINNTGILADSTRERILQKAVEMGYKQFSYVSFADLNDNTADSVKTSLSIPSPQEYEETPPADPPARTLEDSPSGSSPLSLAAPAEGTSARPGVIALLTGITLGSSHFASVMLDKFQTELTLLGYELVMYHISSFNMEHMVLPALVSKETVSGIICFEIFHEAYSSMICELGIPTLFVDAPVSPCHTMLKADRLLMENRSNIHTFVQEMVRRGKKRIGFVGKIYHCLSFYERYMAYKEALYMLGLPSMDEYCVFISDAISFSNKEDYRHYLAEQLRLMKDLPEVFICANDFVALDVMNQLQEMGISVPDDILICGFDDSSESRVVRPQLTTIHIHSEIMGHTAAHLLMSRISEPALNYRTVYTETTLICRASTGD